MVCPPSQLPVAGRGELRDLDDAGDFGDLVVAAVFALAATVLNLHHHGTGALELGEAPRTGSVLVHGFAKLPKADVLVDTEIQLRRAGDEVENDLHLDHHLVPVEGGFRLVAVDDEGAVELRHRAVLAVLALEVELFEDGAIEVIDHGLEVALGAELELGLHRGVDRGGHKAVGVERGEASTEEAVAQDGIVHLVGSL